MLIKISVSFTADIELRKIRISGFQLANLWLRHLEMIAENSSELLINVNFFAVDSQLAYYFLQAILSVNLHEGTFQLAGFLRNFIENLILKQNNIHTQISSFLFIIGPAILTANKCICDVGEFLLVSRNHFHEQSIMTNNKVTTQKR